jgi:glycosyltransferase involved in cell wall biosynthesis
MLKVASVIPCLSTRGGGPSINLVESVPYLRDAGVELTICTTDMGAPVTARPWRASAADFPSGADECDIRVFRLEPPRRFGYSPALQRALRADLPGFDLARIHGLYLHPQYAASSEAQRDALPYVVSPHGALDPWIRRRGRARKLLTGIAWQDRMLREAAAIHATTHTESDLFGDAIPDGPARRVVGNGVATSRFSSSPGRGALRGELGIPTDTAMILFLGRLSRKKGLDILIRAVGQLARRDLALVVVGPDDESLTPELQRLAREHDILDITHFVGPRYGDERLTALADADLWVLPSYTENFGNAVVEAMAAGVPTVISTEVNLAADVLAAKAGLVAKCNPEEFASEILRLLEDSALRKQVAAAGRSFAQEYDWATVARQLAAMFGEFAR